MFKIIAAGWNCARFITQTLESIDQQGRRDFQVMISYEGLKDDPGFDIIRSWIASRKTSFSSRWEQPHYFTSFRVGLKNFIYGTRARYRGITAMHPADNDIIIWLNLDGDTFAHWRVLDRIWDAYADGFPLVTYGNFQCVPAISAPLLALPYDNAVIVNRSYRSAPFRAADLRTMRYKVYKSIPVNQFQWSSLEPETCLPWSGGVVNGAWYGKVDDLTAMIPALELVGIRHRYIPEVLMHYNTLNPNSGMSIGADETKACDDNFRAKPRLPLLFGTEML